MDKLLFISNNGRCQITFTASSYSPLLSFARITDQAFKEKLLTRADRSGARDRLWAALEAASPEKHESWYSWRAVDCKVFFEFSGCLNLSKRPWQQQSTCKEKTVPAPRTSFNLAEEHAELLLCVNNVHRGEFRETQHAMGHRQWRDCSIGLHLLNMPPQIRLSSRERLLFWCRGRGQRARNHLWKCVDQGLRRQGYNLLTARSNLMHRRCWRVYRHWSKRFPEDLSWNPRPCYEPWR